MKMICSLLALTVFLCSCSERIYPSSNLNESEHILYPFLNKLPYHEDYKIGYIDSLGNIIITPKYTQASEFSDELACMTITLAHIKIETQ